VLLAGGNGLWPPKAVVINADLALHGFDLFLGHKNSL